MIDGPSKAVVDHLPSLTVIVDGESGDDPGLPEAVAAVRDAVASARVIVVTTDPLPPMPAGVETLTYAAPGRGDRFDAAAQRADTDLIAFLDRRVVPNAEWIDAITRAMADPSVGMVGGPVIPVGTTRSERVAAYIAGHYLGRTPAGHNARVAGAGAVKELNSSNIAVRRSVFRAVGGFQTPVGGGEGVRLSYKVRTLHGSEVRYEPAMACPAPGPGAVRDLVRDVAHYGRFRGDMARHLPEASPVMPYVLPSIGLVALVVAAAAIVIEWSSAIRWVAVAIGLLTIIAILRAVATRADGGRATDRALASLALAPILGVFGLAFISGYFGRTRSEVSPAPQDPPLRVLVVAWRDITHPWAGGAERYMHEIAKRWAAEGIDVVWLTQRHASSDKRSLIDGIRIHRAGGRFTQYPRAALAIMRLRRHCDVIVDCENGIPFFTPLYGGRRTILVVHHVHEEIFRTLVPRGMRWLFLWLEGRAMPRVYRRCPVVAVSKDTRNHLIDIGFRPEQISVVNNGVDPPAAARVNPAPSPTMLCMGRLAPRKCVDVLLRAMPSVVAEFPEVTLHVVGQGPDRIRLERLAWSLGLAPHVRFHGYVSAAVRDDIAAESWLAVCPSAFEGWGLVCMEAGARGLPVIASDVQGLRESVRNGETGILVPQGDEHALGAAISALLADPARRRALGDAGRVWAAAHTWDRSAEEFRNLVMAQVPAALALTRG
jgi:glycosyltransferase involved in cell wall biosynthesis